MWQYNNELYHYGVLGMKWGRRKYQNKDGSLTPAGKKRVSAAYKKEMSKVSKKMAKTNTSRKMRAYNLAADDLNNGLIKKYNEEYDKKLGNKAKGHDYGSDEKYLEGFDKMANSLRDRYYNRLTYYEMTSNKNYKKATSLVEKYSMTSFDNLAKSNSDIIEELKRKMQ